MAWKCQVCVVLGEPPDCEVVTLERSSNDLLTGLNLCWMEAMEKVSTLHKQGPANWKSVQVLGWGDPIFEPYRSDDALRSQRLLDGSRRDRLTEQRTLEEKEEAERGRQT